MLIVFIVLASIVAIWILFEILSLLIYKRFLFTTIVAFYINHFRYTPFRKSEEECYRLINIPHTEYSIPKNIKFCCSLSKKKEHNMNVYYLNEESKSNNVFIYFHGGGFYNNFDKHYWFMLNKIIKNTDALVIAPDYPLIPDVRCDSLFPLLLDFYKDIKNRYHNKRIIIGGDSAGGNISFVLGELLEKEYQPDEIILLSPAIDMSIPNEDIPSFDKCIFIDKESWPAIANMWRGDGMKDEHPLMSPIYGDYTNIRHMTVFYGNREFCYNSIERLKAKTKDNKKFKFKLYKGMYHVWVATPVYEAHKALKEIYKIIKINPTI